MLFVPGAGGTVQVHTTQKLLKKLRLINARAAALFPTCNLTFTKQRTLCTKNNLYYRYIIPTICELDVNDLHVALEDFYNVFLFQ